MALELISDLFTDREGVITPQDVQYSVERFLQEQLHTEKIRCRVVGASLGIEVRVGSPALAEAVLIREESVRGNIQNGLGCSLGDMRVILDV